MFGIVFPINSRIEAAYYVLQEKTEVLLPDGWRQIKFGEVASISTGKTNSQDATFDCKAVIVPGEGRSFAPRYFSGEQDALGTPRHPPPKLISGEFKIADSMLYLYEMVTLNE